MARNYFVNIAELTGYSPANHTETVNKRVIGPETVGAKQLEVVLGHVKKNAGALPHAHPGIEQVCYMLEGRARVEVGGQSREIGPGEACFFPADEKHANRRRPERRLTNCRVASGIVSPGTKTN
jgi:quercetin dioxygenase-like cupin family protein